VVLGEDGTMATEIRTIIVSGNIQTVYDKLVRLRETIKNRDVLGFTLLQHDEEWMFIGARDERECPICRSKEHTIHRGNFIPNRFPFYRFLDSTHIHPQVHIYCRCILELENPGETMRNRLHEELTKVI